MNGTRHQRRHTTGGASPALKVKAGVALGLVCAALLLQLPVLCHLQIAEADRYRRLAQRQHELTRSLAARRGSIYDRCGRLLAASVRRWSVYADPQGLDEPDRAATVLARALGLRAGLLRRKFARECSFVWVKRQVTDGEADMVRRLGLKGVYLRAEHKRLYPQGRLAAQLIGFTDIDGRGLSGVELQMDELLRGRPGLENVRCDGGRRVFRTPLDRPARAPFDGYDVYLTIDTYVQQIVEQELAAAAEMHRPECATAIVMDTRDGSVLAMASWPPFDPHRPTASPVSYQRNIAVCDALEFGSAFKPITVGLALNAGAVEPDTQFDCHQGVWKAGYRVLHDAHPYGTLSVSDIICHSSNIGAAQIALRLGKERLYEGLRAFGFGRRSGIALPGETGGIVRPFAAWTDDSVMSIAFGQEIAVTPLAMARAFAAIANGGALLQPRIVRAIVQSDTGKVVYEAGPPVVVGRPLGQAAASQLVAMMRRVVEEGTGRRARLEQYAVAGKTGTAQLLRPDGRGYSDTRYLASFIGIAPVPNCRIVVLVSLKAPSKGSHYGGVCAAPAVGKIILRTLRYLGVPPTEPTLLALGDSL